jgi:hypothetical protein
MIGIYLQKNPSNLLEFEQEDIMGRSFTRFLIKLRSTGTLKSQASLLTLPSSVCNSSKSVAVCHSGNIYVSGTGFCNSEYFFHVTLHFEDKTTAIS